MQGKAVADLLQRIVDRLRIGGDADIDAQQFDPHPGIERISAIRLGLDPFLKSSVAAKALLEYLGQDLFDLAGYLVFRPNLTAADFGVAFLETLVVLAWHLRLYRPTIEPPK